MRFNFKLSIPGGASYEEIIEIDDKIANKLMRDYELDEFLDMKIKNWAEDNIEYEWEKVYGRD